MTAFKTDPDVAAALDAAMTAVGKGKVLQILSAVTASQSGETETLTIVVNEGVHHLPEEYKRGEVFVASRGSLNFSSVESLHEEFRRVVRATARKLKSQAWSRVYIVPFGPTALSMQIKLLVYWVCGFQSIEVMHVPGEPRVDVSIDLRKLILESDTAQ
jgi:hypothetical protein